MVNYKLPFYGKRGSIGEIKETESGFQVLTYNVDGDKFNETIMIRNTPSNRIDLLNNFFQNVEEYLKINQNKFIELKNKEKKNVANKNMAMIILIVSVLLGIGIPGVGICLGTANFGSLGASLIVGAAFATASVISLKNGKENESIDDFVKNYYNLQHELKIYKEERNKAMREKKDVKSRSLSPSSYDKINTSVLRKRRSKD